MEGIKSKLPYPEYDAVEAISRRCLVKDRNWARTRYYLDHPRQETEAQVDGRVVHHAVLEKDTVDKVYYFVDDYSRATKAGKERWAKDEAAAGGRTIVRGYDAMAIAASVHNHPAAHKALTGGEAEVSLFWRDQGDLCKGRLDYLREGVIVELKTTQCAAPQAFVRELVKWEYHVQLAWYYTGLSQFMPVRGCAIIAVEKSPPYCVAVYYLKSDDMFKAIELMQSRLQEYRRCRDAQRWEAYSPSPEELRIPAWAWGDSMEVVLDY